MACWLVILWKSAANNRRWCSICCANCKLGVFDFKSLPPVDIIRVPAEDARLVVGNRSRRRCRWPCTQLRRLRWMKTALWRQLLRFLSRHSAIDRTPVGICRYWFRNWKSRIQFNEDMEVCRIYIVMIALDLIWKDCIHSFILEHFEKVVQYWFWKW